MAGLVLFSRDKGLQISQVDLLPVGIVQEDALMDQPDPVSEGASQGDC
jgi:hypothetical protein